MASFSFLSLQGCDCGHCVPCRHGHHAPSLGARLALSRLHPKGTVAFSTPCHPIVCSSAISIMPLHPLLQNQLCLNVRFSEKVNLLFRASGFRVYPLTFYWQTTVHPHKCSCLLSEGFSVVCLVSAVLAVCRLI